MILSHCVQQKGLVLLETRPFFYKNMNTLNKDRPLSIVYKAVLTIFMLYVYAQNIDIILRRRQVKKAMAKIVAKQAK